MAHPYKLHPELWYNERNELNDGPACACKKRHQTGPLHNKFEGEEVSRVKQRLSFEDGVPALIFLLHPLTAIASLIHVRAHMYTPSL